MSPAEVGDGRASTITINVIPDGIPRPSVLVAAIPGRQAHGRQRQEKEELEWPLEPRAHGHPRAPSTSDRAEVECQKTGDGPSGKEIHPWFLPRLNCRRGDERTFPGHRPCNAIGVPTGRLHAGPWADWSQNTSPRNNLRPMRPKAKIRGRGTTMSKCTDFANFTGPPAERESSHSHANPQFDGRALPGFWHAGCHYWLRDWYRAPSGRGRSQHAAAGRSPLKQLYCIPQDMLLKQFAPDRVQPQLIGHFAAPELRSVNGVVAAPSADERRSRSCARYWSLLFGPAREWFGCARAARRRVPCGPAQCDDRIEAALRLRPDSPGAVGNQRPVTGRGSGCASPIW